MWSTIVLSCALSGVLAEPLHVPIKGYQTNRAIFARHSSLEKRASDLELENLLSYYRATLNIGTPSQEVVFTIDTGSSDLWVMSSDNPYCATSSAEIEAGTNPNCSAKITFDASSSSTVSENTTAFSLSYGDGSFASGNYVTDVVRIGDATLSHQSFAIANESNSTEAVFGIGPIGAEATVTQVDSSGNFLGAYANVPVGLREQGIISSVTYSLWLNDIDAQEGSILFGGVDHGKYTGELSLVPMIPYSSSGPLSVSTPILPFVMLHRIGGYSSSGKGGDIASFSIPVLLDSGSSICYLPSSIVTAMGAALNAEYSSSVESYVLSCNSNVIAGFEFDFSGTIIYAPLRQMLLPLSTTSGSAARDSSGNALCQLAVMPSDSTWILGDLFLRSAYVVYDNDNYQVALANTRFNSTDSDVEDIHSSTPSATSAASYSSTTVATRISTQSLSMTSSVSIPTSGSSSNSSSPNSSSSSTRGSSSSSSSSSSHKNGASSHHHSGYALLVAAFACAYMC